MSGAQGAQPKGAFTATTYRSAAAAATGGEEESRQPPARTELRSSEDERGLPVKRLEDKVDDAAGKGGPVFGAGEDDGKRDLGVTGTGGG
uniref:Seed maturation protein PM41 n=1 Tax=Oryza punctata TaxID=4537 RepID=A0A0E0LUI4_ORYPU